LPGDVATGAGSGTPVDDPAALLHSTSPRPAGCLAWPMSLDADIHDLFIEVNRAEVIPPLPSEIRAALSACRPSDTSKVLTVAMVAEILKVTTETVLDWIHAGKLGAFKLPGGNGYRVHKEDFDKLMKSGCPITGAVDSASVADRILSEVQQSKLGGR